jgi:hypothetical protein
MLQVKYVTMQDLIRLGIIRDADAVSRFSPGSVYPVQKATPMFDELRVSVTIATDYRGGWYSFALPQADYNALQSLPTHETVADVPRKDCRDGVA